MCFKNLLMILLFSFANLLGAPDEKSKVEIEHLLNFIKNSDVIFIRNGKEYSAKDAEEHIRSKYTHYYKKIKTTEEFIEKSATKSILSGDVYQVKLKDSAKIETSVWLLAELKVYREKEKAENK